MSVRFATARSKVAGEPSVHLTPALARWLGREATMVVLGRADPSPGARGQLSEPGPARRAGRLPDFGFLAPLQPIAAALHRRGELLEVHLERVEDVVGVVLGAEPDLALAGASLLDDLLGLALGLLHDLLLGDQPHLLVARLLEDPLRLA